MLAKLAGNVALITAVSVAAVVYLGGKDMSAPAATADTEIAVPPKATTSPKRAASASTVSIPKDRRSGQYLTTGRVNSGYVEFLVDTGASVVALTYEDARKAGIRLNDLVYDAPVSTAGGTRYAARVRLDSVALGGITLRNVDAMVLRDGLDISLLGMSWLGQLQKVEATPNALLLRL